MTVIFSAILNQTNTGIYFLPLVITLPGRQGSLVTWSTIIMYVGLIDPIKYFLHILLMMNCKITIAS